VGVSRCAWGPGDGRKRVRDSVHGAELDLQTVVWTRGAGFPLARLESRLKCPRCGSRRVVLLFGSPSGARTGIVVLASRSPICRRNVVVGATPDGLSRRNREWVRRSSSAT
jgi:hypothetical protein